MTTKLLGTTILVALASALASGCGSDDAYAKVLRVDPGGFHVRGDYIGSQKRVKLFVEHIHAEPLRSGRGTLYSIKLALLNERNSPITFDFVQAHLTVGPLGAPAVETHTIRIEPGELRRIPVTFRSGVSFEDVQGGEFDFDGISPDETGAKVSFHVPFSVTDLTVKDDRH